MSGEHFEPLPEGERRVWWMPPWTLSGPVLGVPGARPPFWRGGDEYGRRTIVIQAPFLGALVFAARRPMAEVTFSAPGETTQR